MSEFKKALSTESAPAAVGAYSQAVEVSGVGRTVYLSGQIPLDPKSMTIVGVEDVEAQTHQVMRNLKAVLLEAKLDFKDLVRCTIFIKDMNDFAKVNTVYASYLSAPFPARACVEVARLPRDVLVEIDGIAVGK